jgi:uncharacterized membrane protein YcgQ (UPF0703/DUF1980 family)
MITGKSMEAKAGAVIVTDENIIYYIDGLDYWEKKYSGKKIKVIGKIVNENLKKKDKGGELIQEIVGTKRVVKNPKFVFLE